MLTYYSLKEGLAYRTYCPACDGVMQINDANLVSSEHIYEPASEGLRHKLTLRVDQYGERTLTIDVDTSTVEMMREQSIDDFVYSIPGILTAKISSSQPFTGTFIQALHIDCRSCCQYGFALQLYFDLTRTARLGAVYLNSEYINVEDGPAVHVIKNSYASSETYYTYFGKTDGAKMATLPIIPLNVHDPKETVARIRKLLPFS